MASFELQFPSMSPDGKHLFVCSSERLHRFVIKGTSLMWEESGPRIGQNPQGIEVSIDSKYVALPSGGGNYAEVGHPNVGYGTYIYSVEDLKLPRIGIKTGDSGGLRTFETGAAAAAGLRARRQLLTTTRNSHGT